MIKTNDPQTVETDIQREKMERGILRCDWEDCLVDVGRGYWGEGKNVLEVY